MLKWPVYENKPADNQTNAVGNAMQPLIDYAVAQSAANARQLQQARANEAKRQREESIAAARVLTQEHPCK